jgi:hypothetical protein
MIRIHYRVGIGFLIFVLFSAFAVDNIPASEDQGSSQKLITDFQSADERKNWRIVNDVVMGGISKSEFVILDNAIAVFRGTLSLENNGGFASVRTFPTRITISQDLTVLQSGSGAMVRDTRFACRMGR